MSPARVSVASDARRYVILADGFLDDYHAKTAHGVLRYGRDEVVAVVDSVHAGRTVDEIVPFIARRTPIVASLREALAYRPTSVLIGVATDGGFMPPAFLDDVLLAADHGLEIVSGLHDLLSDHPEIVARANAGGARLWDVRVPHDDIGVFSGAAYDVQKPVVLAVGSDCAVGKMTAMLEIENAARADEKHLEFIATGQTGILIAGKGIAVDHVLSDFVAGAGERLVLDANPEAVALLVEGQGSIIHPAYAPVTFGLLLGCAPDLLIMCHEVGRDRIGGFSVPIPRLGELIRLHDIYLQSIKPAPCIAIVLNTGAIGATEAAVEIARIEAETGLPTDDPVRNGGDKIWKALARALPSVRKKGAAVAST